jgi:D-3-phosphoglycerate dehydrogenase
MTNATPSTVLITGRTLAPEAVALLKQAGLEVAFAGDYPDEATLLATIGARRPVALLHRGGRINAKVLAAGRPELVVVARHGVGMDGVDIEAARALGITVVRPAGANAPAVAEHTMAVLLALLKDLPGTTARMRTGRWEKTHTRDADGLTLGIVGYGAIGSRVARLAGAFGTNILAYDPYIPDELPGPGRKLPDLKAMLSQCDAVSVHCPLNDETRGMIGAAELAAMPRGALVVNAARGGIVDEAELQAALAEGQVAGAALDVFNTEPLPADSAWRTHPNVIATPHVAGSSRRCVPAVATRAAEYIVEVLAGRTPAQPGAVVVPGARLERVGPPVA